MSQIQFDGYIKFDDSIICEKCGRRPMGEETWYARADDQYADDGAIVLPVTCGECYGQMQGKGGTP